MTQNLVDAVIFVGLPMTALGRREPEWGKALAPAGGCLTVNHAHGIEKV